MKILGIFPEYNLRITGGQIYDHYFISRLSSQDCISLDLYKKKSKNHDSFFALFSYLRLIYTSKEYDVIITNSRYYSKFLILFFILNVFYSKKIILFHHHFSFMTEKGIKQKLHRCFELSFLKQASEVIIPSPYIKELMGKIIPKKNIAYIPLAFKSGDDILISNLDNGNKLLYVGTIEPRKGIIFLLQALSLLKEQHISFSCTIAGSVTNESYYQDLIQYINKNSLSGNISFLGRVSNEELNKLYTESDCFVFPSLHEGFGMVLVEAMSHGLPVIAFNNSAMPYTVKDKINGILVKDSSAEDFSEAVKNVLVNKKLRIDLGNEAYKTYLNSYSYIELNKDIDKFASNL